MLVDSTSPISTPGPSQSPIDLSLKREGSSFAPENALIATTLPETASGSAQLRDSGVGIEYQSESDHHALGSLIADRGAVFYHEVDTDTDLVSTPTTTGLELFAQLRSANSPTEFHFDLDMPSGATLAQSQLEGGLEIVRGGRMLAELPPAAAIDANGDPVSVAMTPEAAGLRLDVDADANARYPILVDPELVDNYNWPAGATFGGWTSYGTDPDYERWAFSSYFTPGLYNLAPAGRNYASGSVSDWYYRVPNADGPSGTTAYISDAILKDVQFAAPYDSPMYRPRMVIGLWSKHERWVRMLDWASSFNYAGDLSLATWALLKPGTAVSESQRLDFQFYVPADGLSANPTQSRSGRLSNVEIHLADPEAPTVAVSGVGGWTDGTAPISVHSEVTDPGLGVKVETLVPGFDQAGNVLPGIDVRTADCTGTATSPCSRTSSCDYTVDPQTLGDGLQFALPVAWDAVGQGSMGGAWYGIDRTPPEITDLSGRMLTSAGGSTLRVVAEDGSPYRGDASVKSSEVV